MKAVASIRNSKGFGVKKSSYEIFLLAIALFSVTAAALPRATFAHCPLCTIGAGAAAVGAAWLGVSYMVIGVFLGAFGLAIGLWTAG